MGLIKRSARITQDNQLANQEQVRVEALVLPGSGAFPGHPTLPPLLYKKAFLLSSQLAARGAAEDPSPAAFVERVFGQNGWRNGWRDTVYDYDHYHSTAHEVLGCYRGSATLQLGGESGPRCELEPGDVLLLPAGTTHKKLAERDGFAVVGCYAEGRQYDMRCGAEDEDHESAMARLEALPLPARDPVFGSQGPLSRYLVRS